MKQGHALSLSLLAFCAGLALAWWLKPQAGHKATDKLQQQSEDAGPQKTEAPKTLAKLSAADHNFNPGWIGAACTSDDDCAYDQGFCLMAEEGYPNGSCSRPCKKFCPDKKGDLYAPTFCVEDPSYGDRGLCMARCNLHLTTSGCRPGYVCSTMFRLHSQKTHLICQAQQGTPAPGNACINKLDQLGLHYSRPDLADALARAAHQGDPMPTETSCQVDSPVLLASPIHHVDFRERGQRFPEHLLVSCKFALAIESFAQFLQKRDIVEVEHLGAFNCRSISGTRKLSAHGRGMALDVAGFEPLEGEHLSILADWNGNNKVRRKKIRALVRDLRRSKIFSRVLGPDTNKAHKNHLHLELRTTE